MFSSFALITKMPSVIFKLESGTMKEITIQTFYL